MMPQRTAEITLVIPTPMIALLEVCVVLTGKPMFEANSMTLAAARFAANPLGGESRVNFIPKVWITRHPPTAVPIPMAIPEAPCIHGNTVTSCEA